MPEFDNTVLQDIAMTSASLAALHEQARRRKTSHLSLEAIEAEITAGRAENTADMGHGKP